MRRKQGRGRNMDEEGTMSRKKHGRGGKIKMKTRKKIKQG